MFFMSESNQNPNKTASEAIADFIKYHKRDIQIKYFTKSGEEGFLCYYYLPLHSNVNHLQPILCVENRREFKKWDSILLIEDKFKDPIKFNIVKVSNKFYIEKNV